MKQFIKLLFLIFLPMVSLCQLEQSFAEQVAECYSQEKFKDIIFRLTNENECFVGLEFPKVVLTDINDIEITNYDFENKVIVINFWFTACPPCLEEIPLFNKLSENYSDSDVIFIAPSTDDTPVIELFLKQYGEYKSTIIPNSKALFRDILGSKSGFPTTIVIDKKGIIRYYSCGNLRTYEILDSKIKSLLSEK